MINNAYMGRDNARCMRHFLDFEIGPKLNANKELVKLPLSGGTTSPPVLLIAQCCSVGMDITNDLPQPKGCDIIVGMGAE